MSEKPRGISLLRERHCVEVFPDGRVKIDGAEYAADDPVAVQHRLLFGPGVVEDGYVQVIDGPLNVQPYRVTGIDHEHRIITFEPAPKETP